MMTIAHRKNYIGVFYSLLLLIGIAEIASCIADQLPMPSITVGVLVAAISVWMLVGFFKTSNNAIILDEENDILLLSKSTKIALNDICDVSCRQARARYGGKLDWGSIIITTYANETHKLRCVDNCEYVVDRINQLKKEARNRGETK